MGLFRRRETLQERARRDVVAGRDLADATWAPPWMEVGVHGTARPRRWDVVVTAQLELPGDTASFVALPGGGLLVESGGKVVERALAPLVAEIEMTLRPPYRVEALRREGAVWAAAARAIEVVELPAGTSGHDIVLSVTDGERTLTVDDFPSFGSVPALERLGASRSDSYVV